MAKGRPVGVDSPGGGETVVSSPATRTPAATCATCCLSRSGRVDMPRRSRDFKRMFKEYGRSRVWFRDARSARYDPANVAWEPYYYRGTYGYELAYQVRSATAGPANGTISITLRINPTPHTVSNRALTTGYPGLFSPVTETTITNSVTGWNTAVQTHWTNRYTVQLGAPDCPGDFPIQFTLQRDSRRDHVAFTVLNMRHPNTDPALRAALANPENPRNATAVLLAAEGRSNAAKFNIGDDRGNLVFAHEFGHWMGWGDEYIEVSGTTADGRAYDNRHVAGQVNSLRVAIKIKNPTKRYQDSNGGSTTEIVDITPRVVVENLMASMGWEGNGRPTYNKRCVYTIVDDFVTLYNQNHYGGRATAYCIDVLVRR